MILILSFLVAGIVLILAEVFLPGLIAGLMGACFLAVAAILTFIEYGPAQGLLLVLLELTGGTVLFILWLRIFPKTPLGKRMILDSTSQEDSEAAALAALTGTTGESLTYLRPAGTAILNGKRYDVVAEGPLIEARTPVVVAKVEGRRIIVREHSIKPSPSEENPS
jgi:membrane-bound serine protease (ClpP class)